MELQSLSILAADLSMWADECWLNERKATGRNFTISRFYVWHQPASRPASQPASQSSEGVGVARGSLQERKHAEEKHWKLSFLFFPQVNTQIINAHWPTWCSNFQLQVTERRALLQWDCRETTAQRKHQNHSLGVCSDFKLIASPALDLQISES